MKAPRQVTRGAHDQGGFVLPGVIMFVVVLTILGLSLFALSGFESQFLSASLDRSQAFYNASGAIDRARFLLSVMPSNLESVASNLGADVDSVIATQGVATSGPVQWNSTDPVVIRARAHKNGESRVLMASFTPVWSQVYDNLFSLFSTEKGLEVTDQSVNSHPYMHTYLYGTLWQTYQGTNPDWYDELYPFGNSLSGDLQPQFGSLPVPNIQAFQSQFWAVARPDSEVASGNREFHLIGPPGGIRFFRTAVAPTDTFSLNIVTGVRADIYVGGIAIWMLDAGIRSEKEITVHGTTGNDMLVIVARRQTKSYTQSGAGVLFNTGITSPEVPLIIVSDGYLRHGNEENGNFVSVINWLCIYAEHAWIQGPHGPYPPPVGDRMIFSHVPGNPQAEENLQKLLDGGYLPNANGLRRRLSYIPGTWLDLGTSN